MVKFKQWNCKAKRGMYPNGNTAIQLFTEDGEPIAKGTVNLYDKLSKNKAYIKDYSENEGMLESLKEAGIVTEIIGYKQTGFVVVPLCKLNLALLE